MEEIKGLKLSSFENLWDKMKYIPGDIIVRIAYKYDWEKVWHEENELLLYKDNDWIWENDWDEGYTLQEEEPLVLWWIPVYQVGVHEVYKPEDIKGWLPEKV